jgi:outer membrane protein assembly factor BamB
VRRRSAWRHADGAHSRVTSRPGGQGAFRFSSSLIPTLTRKSGDGPLYALNAATGAVRWTFPKPQNSIFASPAIANGKVYIPEDDGSIYALVAATGALAWSDNINPTSNIYATPAVANGVVYVGTNDSTLWALDAANGAKVWAVRTPFSDIFYSSLAVANGVLYAGSGIAGVYVVNAATGEILTTLNAKGTYYSSPAVVNGMVYAGSFMDRKLHAWDYRRKSVDSSNNGESAQRRPPFQIACILPILLVPRSVNHIAPSGPAAMP